MMYQQGFSDMFIHNHYNREGLSAVKADNKLKVFGKGSINVKPDVAEVTIGVITENQQLDVAQEENSRITKQVIDSIKGMEVLAEDIQTENYNINANYDYIDGKQVFRGYLVSNYLKVSIKNIDEVGAVIDTAIKNGANNVRGITFIVSDSARYYYEALRLAIDDAQNKAMSIANSLKVKLNLVPIQIYEQSNRTMAPLSMNLKAAVLSTPIEPGENKITADIEAIFIYTE